VSWRTDTRCHHRALRSRRTDPARADTRDFGSGDNAQKKAEWRGPRISDKWREFGVETKMAQRRSFGGVSLKISFFAAATAVLLLEACAPSEGVDGAASPESPEQVSDDQYSHQVTPVGTTHQSNFRMAALGTSIPQDDVNKICERAKVGSLPEDRVGAMRNCVGEETSARDELRRDWGTKYAVADRSNCASTPGMQFSYVELLTCLQMQHGGRNLGNGSAIGLAAKTPTLTPPSPSP
jgi:hypothetical protein